MLAAVLALPARLPAGATLSGWFAARGRRAPAALAAFHLLAIAANPEVWREGLLTESVRLDLVLTIVAVAGFLGRGRVPVGAAIVYAGLTAWGIHVLSPLGY